MKRAPELNNRLRIIGGRWRSRQLTFPPLAGLRPTPDRVRETLFNWLASVIQGSRCLDLFAGSGALGMEALSRGAVEVVFVEDHPVAVRYLQNNLQRLGVKAAQVQQCDALYWLQGSPRPFDIVFLDPPFGEDLLSPSCVLLERRGWLASAARIYLEAERSLNDLHLPATWQIVREKTAGHVVYRLAENKICK
jgi:16S rRNA (guanine966-N2)-methyltransferase